MMELILRCASWPEDEREARIAEALAMVVEMAARTPAKGKIDSGSPRKSPPRTKA